MKTEYEATFLDIDREDLIRKFKTIGGYIKRPEFLQRRVTLELPKDRKDEHTWLRVRDECDKVTLTLKSVDGKTITGQKEILIEVNDFRETVVLLESIGCKKKSYQESKRELWQYGNVEFALDTWPFLDTYLEIESGSEEEVREIARKLDLDYDAAVFDTVNGIYKKKYGKTLDELDKEVLKSFTFEIPNPFIQYNT
jgi:adenylate cyclase class 2